MVEKESRKGRSLTSDARCSPARLKAELDHGPRSNVIDKINLYKQPEMNATRWHASYINA